MDIEKIMNELTLEEKAGLCSGLDFWHFKGVERLEIPSLMVCDGPHGLRKQEGEADMLGMNESIKAVCFPTASALAASFDTELLNRVGQLLGDECRAEQVSVLLGPGVNMKRSPLCGRNFEYFSEDPLLSSGLATAFIKGVQSRHVGVSMKHFCANNQEYDRMGSDSEVDERALHEIYLASFEDAVKNAHPATIMCSYNKINGVYAAENRDLLTGVLRDRWGYEGCVITDWGAGKNRVLGLKAGLDIEMPGGNPIPDRKIIEAVRSGELEERVLDQTVERVLRLIAFCTEKQEETNRFDRDRDHEIAGQIAAECAVLLKNEDGVLPVSEEKKIAFLGSFAENPRYQGSGSSHINSWKVTSARKAAAGNPNVTYAKGYEETDCENDALLAEAVACAKAAQAAVIFAGLPGSMESEGMDRAHMKMPKNQLLLIEEVAKVQPNTVVMLHNGSPVEMPWLDRVKGVLEMYLGGENVGQAAYDLLFGKRNPCGKLAETFPRKLSDNPSYLNFPGNNHVAAYREGIYIGYRYYDKKEMDVLFPFGHGLSYTEFSYENLRLDKTQMDENEVLTVTAEICNTGTRKGKEAVQLYVSDLQSTIDRPVRELKGFCKVELTPGERKEVSFTLDKRSFAYYNITLHDWHVETGDFTIALGSSSRDIRLSETVKVISLTEVPVTYTRYATLGEILRTRRGQMVLKPVMDAMSAAGGDDTTGSNTAMGEGTEEMMNAMMLSMPIDTLLKFGAISEEQLSQMLTALND